MGSMFFERFSALCKERDETPNSVAKMIGASSGSVTAWKKGTDPRNATLAKIADYFGVTTDYLLGKDNKKSPNDTSVLGIDILDEVDVAFYGDYKELDEDDKATLRDMARIMRERRARKQEK